MLFLESRYEQFLNSTFGLQRRSVKVQQCVIVDLSVPAAPSNERGGGFFCSPVRPSSLQVFKWGGGGGAGSSTLKFHFSPEQGKVEEEGGRRGKGGKRKLYRCLSSLPAGMEEEKSETLGFRIGGGDIGVGGTSVFPPSPWVPRRGTAASGPCRSRPRGIV